MIVDVFDYTGPSSMNPTIDEFYRSRYHNSMARASPRSVFVTILPTDTLRSFVDRVANACRAQGPMDLLRIHGHGGPGVSLHGTMTEASIRTGSYHKLLRHHFKQGVNAQAYLMGCDVGQAPSMLIDLARDWNVPVTAGLSSQLTGSAVSHFTFEGPTVTADPNGRVYFNRPGIPSVPHLI